MELPSADDCLQAHGQSGGESALRAMGSARPHMPHPGGLRGVQAPGDATQVVGRRQGHVEEKEALPAAGRGDTRGESSGLACVASLSSAKGISVLLPPVSTACVDHSAEMGIADT